MKGIFRLTVALLTTMVPVVLLGADPQFEGRTAAAWIQVGATNMGAWSKPLEALRELGPEAMPALLGTLKELRKDFSNSASNAVDQFSLGSLVFQSLEELGPDAKPAIPDFI